MRLRPPPASRCVMSRAGQELPPSSSSAAAAASVSKVPFQAPCSAYLKDPPSVGAKDSDIMALRLPDDVLAGIFRRLAPRSLAASRRVCKAWRDAIDARRLLRADLLPHSLRGIFLQYELFDFAAFLARPSAVPALNAKLDFLLDPARSGFACLLDHCNGLLLYQDQRGLHVINPATERGACLPPPPCEHVSRQMAHLVFDPAQSPHYVVFLVPDNPHREEKIIQCLQASDTASTSIISGRTPLLQLSSSAADGREQPDVSLPVERLIDWPAPTCVLPVFSSQTGRWGEREFSREGKGAGMVAVPSDWEYNYWWGYAVYWRDALYVQCTMGKFIMRISFSNDKYRVIEMPSDLRVDDWYHSYLGKSEKGLSLAYIPDWYELFVWVLDESRDQIDWVLRHKINMRPFFCVLDIGKLTEGSWILQHVSNDADNDDVINADYDPVAKEKSFEWDSDNDDVISADYEAARKFGGSMRVLGFHPYKDVVFLSLGVERAVAYHLNSSMGQDLGNIFPKDYDEIGGWFKGIEMSFPYTPCLMEFPENNLEGHDQD